MLEPEDGISPQTAGTFLTIVALLGIGLYTLSVMLETKSPDPLYDPDSLTTHTSSRLMETPDLWTGKKPPVEDTPTPPIPARPIRPVTTSPFSP